MELSKAKQGIYSQLSRRKMRDRHGLFIAEGRKSIEDTIGSFEVEAIVTTIARTGSNWKTRRRYAG